MIILGVDPGTFFCGYGIIELKKTTPVYINSGVINLTKEKELPQKLKIIYNKIEELISEFSPNEFAIETAFYGKNIQSAMKIGYARGVALLAAVHSDLHITEYSPREVKKAVVGTGAASKEQIQYMVSSFLKINTDKKKFDETDALAIALCHAFRFKSVAQKNVSWKSFVEAFPERIIG